MNETLDVGGLVQPLAEWLEVVASGIDLIGIGIILWGFLRALVSFVRAEVKRVFHSEGLGCLHEVRVALGTYILVGIEFMIASDIINTVLTRELRDLVFVFALVVIRTAISFFLGRELAELQS